MRTQYVIGFLFDDAGHRVALIQKNRPAWQAGKWNGVGGKVEPTENSYQAMVREFEEETGVALRSWSQFAVVLGKEFALHCFKCFNSAKLSDVRTTTDEQVQVWDSDVSGLSVINNLHWLIPMALKDGNYFFEIHQ